jgi:hypothetical protein
MQRRPRNFFFPHLPELTAALNGGFLLDLIPGFERTMGPWTMASGIDR